MTGVVFNMPEAPAATDVFVGARSQTDINARVGDFVAFLHDHGVEVIRGATEYAAENDPPVCLKGWTFTKVRDVDRPFAVFRFQ